MDTQLDASNYSSYTYFAAEQFQYGTDVVPMAGPYGFVMYGSVYNGQLFWLRLVAQLACSAILAALLLWFFRQAAGSPLRWLWLPLWLLLTPSIEDLTFDWLILLTGLLLLQAPPQARARLWVGLPAALLGFVSLIKGTHLILSVATLLVVLGHHAWRGEARRALAISTSYLAAFLLFWILAGQDPRNIGDFLRGVLALTRGYNEAMALDENRATFLRGSLAFALLLTAFGWGAWRRRNDATAMAGTLLLLGFTFVKWKHGFVRADGHVLIFHHYAAAAVLAWFLFVFVTHRDRQQPPRVRRVALALMFAGLGASLWTGSPGQSLYHLKWLSGTWAVQHARTAFHQLLRPVSSRAKLERRLDTQRERHALPLIRQEVGTGPVDLFGLQHGVIPLNGLTYRPRPMGGGSFNAYNRHLMELNGEFLRDHGRRPEHYLMRFETIDDRLATQDDALALLEILHGYRPVLIERQYLLMRDAGTVAPSLVPHSRRSFTFGERVPVPRVADDQMLVAQFEVPLNLRGRLRSALYKAPLVFISLEAEGMEDPEARRLIPGMAAMPFLFSPAVEDNADLARLYTSDEGKRVAAFVIHSDEPSCYGEALHVRFHTLPRPAAPPAPDIDELLAYPRFRLFNLPPESISADIAREDDLRNLPVQILHPPGEITWRFDGTEHEVVFDYGFVPAAYESDGGNGAVFRLELHETGSPPLVLFEHLVDPARDPEQRRNLTARVALPPLLPASRLVLRTDPGPHGDNAWDWCYVTRVLIKRTEEFANELRTNRPLRKVEGERPVIAELETEKVILLHAPGAVTFDLRSGDRRLQLGFGFLPGAHTGDGRTDGADFVVERIRDGAAPEELFRRPLRPVTVAADRGRHTAEVALPDVRAGDRLRVRTTPGAGGSNSWDWTYFSRMLIE